MSLLREMEGAPWPDAAAAVIEDVHWVIDLMKARELPHVEELALVLGLQEEIDTLLDLETCPVPKPNHFALDDLVLVSLFHALNELGTVTAAGPESPQEAYREMQLAAHRALGEMHNPLMDEFPRLVAEFQRVCGLELAEYLLDLNLDYERYLDMLHMVARDQKDAATVENPPARVKLALARKQRRLKELDRERWMPPTQEEQAVAASAGLWGLDELDDPKILESRVMSAVDWDHGRRDIGLPPDQTAAVEARIAGLDLQGAETPRSLGWTEKKLRSVTRSLDPDRRWGSALRRWFAPYKLTNSSNSLKRQQK